MSDPDAEHGITVASATQDITLRAIRDAG